MIWAILAFIAGVVVGWATVIIVVQIGLNRGIVVIAKGPEWQDRFDYKTWQKRE